MSNLITLDNVSLAFGLDILLDHVKLHVTPGERVCLIGRNGAGKSSLLKIIEGVQLPDSGTVWRKPNLRLARLSQELPLDVTKTVFQYVAEGLSETGKLLAEYHELTHRVSISHSEENLKELERLQHLIDNKQGWQFDNEINNILKRLDLNPDTKVAELSGGWQRRAALAKALVVSPELLLLDEPTNHLDLPAIQWLEDQLSNWNIGLIFITHDRALLQRLATRIIELDRGQLTSWPGDYKNFLQRKEEMLHAEGRQNAEFDKKLAQEEKWIRQGIKARRTRNEGRVRALESMRAQRAERREIQGKVNFDINQAKKSGQLVVEAKHISHQFKNQFVIRDFSVRIMRGDRIGFIGPNGIGKTTLLNLLLGKMLPSSGTVTLGTQLEIAYFDQLRATLDYEKTVADNVSFGCDTIEINGAKRHIIGYLSDFLFTPPRALTPVKALSGGECNRLLLARLFSKPANLLVMDEPTNDLDIETLELLEELLNNFKGTLLLVSHDRAFLDNIVTSTLVFEGNGKIQEYIGGYQDWQRQMKKITQDTSTQQFIENKHHIRKSPIKLNNKEQRELAELPQKIARLETEQSELQQLTINEEFYKKSQEHIATVLENLHKITEEIERAYQRWEELENKSG